MVQEDLLQNFMAELRTEGLLAPNTGDHPDSPVEIVISLHSCIRLDRPARLLKHSGVFATPN